MVGADLQEHSEVEEGFDGQIFPESCGNSHEKDLRTY
jgi:hypothetical protein